MSAPDPPSVTHGADEAANAAASIEYDSKLQARLIEAVFDRQPSHRDAMQLRSLVTICPASTTAVTQQQRNPSKKIP